MASTQSFDAANIEGCSAGAAAASSMIAASNTLAVNDGARPAKLSWWPKWVDWNGMLKGHERLAKSHERRAL